MLVVLFQLEIEHKVCQKDEFKQEYTELLTTIKEIILYLLSQSIIPHKEYLFIYYLFESFDFETNPNATSLLEFFQEDIKKLPWDSEDKFTENYLILLLEILNGNKKESLKNFVKNILLTNIHKAQEGLHCQFIEQFSSTIEDFDIDLVLESFEFYLEPKKYFSLSLNEKKSLFAWGYELLLNSSKFTKNLKTKQLYPHLKEIIDTHLQNNEIEELMYAEFFAMITQFTVYQNKEEFENFNNNITYPCSKLYKEFSQNKQLIQPEEYNNKKKKIAFIFERLVEHSPFKVTFSLLEQLQKDENFTDNYEIEIYSLNYFLPLYNVEEIAKSLEDIGVKVIYPMNSYLERDNYSSRVDRALQIRETIINNKVDIMIICCNSHDIFNFLFASRTAPKQIYWSHNTGYYNVENIDMRISHFNQKFFESEFKLIHTKQVEQYKTKQDIEQIDKIRNEVASKKFVLGYIGRLIKIDNYEYLDLVAKILEENPNTIYMFCGSGNENNIFEFFKKKNLEDRIHYPGHVDPDIYGYVIDLWLEPFPLGSGESLIEYIFKEKTFITIAPLSEEEKKAPTYEKYVKYIWVENSEQYIKTAALLINDKNLRDSIIPPLLEEYQQLGHEHTFIDILSH